MMGKNLFLVAALGLALFFLIGPRSSFAATGLAKVCPKVSNPGYHQLYKYQASGHLSGSDRAQSCSFIGGPGAPTVVPNSLPLYDSKGIQLSVFRNYARNGYYRYRFYTYSPTCSTVVATAKRRTKKAVGFIKISSTTCIKISNLAGRVGRAY